MGHYQNERFTEAETLAMFITKEFPMHQFAYKILGAVLKQTGRTAMALTVMQKSIQINPQDAEAQNNLGVILQELGRLNDAKTAYNQAVMLDRNYIEAYKNLGNTFKDQGNFSKAIKIYDKAILINPNDAETHYNKGLALKLLGEIEEALVSYSKSIKLNPNYASAYNNLGNALQYKGKIDDAIKAYKKSILLKPDFAKAHHNLSYALLNCGRLYEGFNEYEWRWKQAKFLSQQQYFSQPLWDGKESLKSKKILLWCEQGIGDTIMWASRLSLLTSKSQHCILKCQEKLVPLFKRSFPKIDIISKHIRKDSTRGDFDFHLPMGSLYKNFIKEILQNPKVDPFLVPDPVRVKFWKRRLKSLGNGPYIGISWKSANLSQKRLPNYCQILELSPILKIDGVTFINLQYVNFEEDLKKIKHQLGITVHNFDDIDHYDDIDNVSALCAALDIVVSTKTTVPLISAGVGTLTKLANWRQSSWNNILHNPVGPAVDIYERNTWEPWENVFNLIKDDIIKLKKNWNR